VLLHIKDCFTRRHGYIGIPHVRRKMRQQNAITNMNPESLTGGSPTWRCSPSLSCFLTHTPFQQHHNLSHHEQNDRSTTEECTSRNLAARTTWKLHPTHGDHRARPWSTVTLSGRLPCVLLPQPDIVLDHGSSNEEGHAEVSFTATYTGVQRTQHCTSKNTTLPSYRPLLQHCK
jgi:hypothetical protein